MVEAFGVPMERIASYALLDARTKALIQRSEQLQIGGDYFLAFFRTKGAVSPANMQNLGDRGLVPLTVTGCQLFKQEAHWKRRVKVINRSKGRRRRL